jgi:hypothetical protein
MTRIYDITIEHEGHVGTVAAQSEAEAIASAEDMIARGEYDLAAGEEYTVCYWLTPGGEPRGDSRTVTVVG